ncbi:MAG: prolyl oligopeptidase family serine peptidase [Blastocatellales bacterium]
MKNAKIHLLIICSIFIGLMLSGASSAQAQTNRGQAVRGMLPTDLSAIKDVGDAQISPDGAKVAYVISEAAPDRSRMVSRLWIVPTSGGESKRLTTSDASESTPRWSPDGKWIAFYSNRDKRDGLWIVPAEGGEPKLVTRVYRTNFYLKAAGESFTWAPDSKRIAFLSSIEVLNEAPPAPVAPVLNDPKLAGVPPQVLRPLSRDEIEKLPVEIREMIFRAQGQAFGQKPSSPIENAISALPDDPRVITRLQYKSRTAFSDNLQSHIFTIDLESRQIRQLTTGLYYEHSINWSPKGDEIIFVSNREPDPDKVNNTDLFTVNVNTFAIRQLTKTKGCEWQPVFSPDGSQIAYLATKREITTIDSVAEDTLAFIIPAQGSERIELSRDFDRRVSAVRWMGNDEVAFLFGDQGMTVLSIMTKSGRLSHKFSHRGSITGFSVSRSLDLAYAASDPASPSELHLMVHRSSTRAPQPFEAGKVKIEPIRPSSQAPLTNRAGAHGRLSRFNEPLLEKLRFSGQLGFGFSNEEFEIQGWLIPPLDFDDKKKYPVILSIHGGPHGMHSYSFNPTVQALAAHGYAVLLVNPRGSSGYGQKFADGCVNDWGGGDYRDLMKGVDEALARFPFLDKDRMGVMGGSYGGYMTNWIVTQTDRFKAAVASASLSNLISFYSTSLYQDLIHAEFNGAPWDNYDLLWDRSPLKHIKNARTPLMLIHGEQDNDVHITQAEEMYTAMRMRGVECVFVRYPREGHGLREPRHREDSLARTLRWFDRFLKK